MFASNISQSHAFAEAISRLCGWSYFLCWSASFYPQFIINYNRKSVTGLALDFFTINVLGCTCYVVSTVLFLFSSTVRDEYARRHPGAEEPTVRWNDLAFAVHALLLSVATLWQFYFCGYKRDASQRMSRTMIAITVACIASIAFTTLLVFIDASWQWIDVIYTLQYVKLCASTVKYAPQAYLNYKRKATTGWSIHNILLDIYGGVLSLIQLVLDSSLQNDWSGLTGNPMKFFLSQITIIFDIIFIVQHYILYRQPSTPLPASTTIEQGYGTISPSLLSPSQKSNETSAYVASPKSKQLYDNEPRGSLTHNEEERRGLLSSGPKETTTGGPSA